MSVKKAKPSITKTKADEKKWNEPEAGAIDIIETKKPARLDNIVVIGNRQIELKPIGKLASLLGFSNAQRHLLTESEINEKDAALEKAEYVIIHNTIWVLSGGSKLNYHAFDTQTAYAEEGDVSVGELNIVYLHASHVNLSSTFKESRIKTVNFLFKVNVSANLLGLESCGVYYTTLKADVVCIKNSVVKEVSITASGVEIKNTKVQAHNITTPGEVQFDKYRTPLSVSGVRMRVFPGNVKNVIIRPNHSLYHKEFAVPSVSGSSKDSFDINIISRVDYGVFNGVNPVNFVRANRCDLLLDGLFISAIELDITYERFKNEVNGANVYTACCGQSDEQYLTTIRALREKAIADGQSARYLPDSTNRIENGLILGFIEQMRSRSNLYKQLDFLMDK